MLLTVHWRKDARCHRQWRWWLAAKQGAGAREVDLEELAFVSYQNE
jgi:hypothetical protein